MILEICKWFYIFKKSFLKRRGMGPCQDHDVVEGHVGGQLCPPEAQIWPDCPERSL